MGLSEGLAQCVLACEEVRRRERIQQPDFELCKSFIWRGYYLLAFPTKIDLCPFCFPVRLTVWTFPNFPILCTSDRTHLLFSFWFFSLVKATLSCWIYMQLFFFHRLTSLACNLQVYLRLFFINPRLQSCLLFLIKRGKMHGSNKLFTRKTHCYFQWGIAHWSL